MASIDSDILQAYRGKAYRLNKGDRVSSLPAAVDYINERGFAFFWPIKGIDLPSLWTAVAGDRPVPSQHDDPGHITWRWKDDSLGQRLWYYAKVLRRKATFISLEMAPYFYALSENYGSPEDDYLISYREGRLTQAAKQIYEALLDRGVLDTITLREAARLSNARDAEFNRALEMLQADLKILPVGVAEAGAWRYAFNYDIVARFYPQLPVKARSLGEAEARLRLVECYFRSVGAARKGDVSRLFRWPADIIERTLSRLTRDGCLVDNLDHPTQPGSWLALAALVV
ncbi:MAG: crosslink repair DNA glycosylase YcaQ family protein [Chloroflexota bacterium]